MSPAGHSQGRELKAKNGSNFLPRLACEETKKDEFNEALCHQIHPFRGLLLCVFFPNCYLVLRLDYFQGLYRKYFANKLKKSKKEKSTKRLEDKYLLVCK